MAVQALDIICLYLKQTSLRAAKRTICLYIYIYIYYIFCIYIFIIIYIYLFLYTCLYLFISQHANTSLVVHTRCAKRCALLHSSVNGVAHLYINKDASRLAKLRQWMLVIIRIIPASGQKIICNHKMDAVASSPYSIKFINVGDNSYNFAPQ